MLSFSIIIPVFNKEEYVEFAVRSVLKQTYANFEIIVIDDGSTDSSTAIIQSINDPRIRLIQQDNAGVSITRNRGIDYANGDLICFLDADDWYDCHYLQSIVTMAEKYPDDAFYATSFKDVLGYSADQWDREQPRPVPFDAVRDFYQKRYQSGTFFCTNSVAIHKQKLAALQPCFPVGESLGEDQDLWFRLAERYTCIFCPLQLTAYRNNVAHSLCASIKSDTLLPVYTRLEHRATRGEIKMPGRRSALLLVADERISVARYLFSQGNRNQALRELMRGYRTIIKKRWWVTLLLCLFGSSTMLMKWEKRQSKLNA